MKKYLIYFLLLATAFTACRKDNTEPINGNTDERLTEELAKYQTQLTSAQFGWKGYLLTSSKIPATFLFSFTDKNRTTMSADYSTTPKESSYRLKALQRPMLLFDSYSTLHLIADPTSSVFGGATGDGYSSDFEFAFISSSPDTIKLEGTFNKSKLILVRSRSAAESASAFDAVEAMSTTISKLRTYFKRTTVGGLEVEVKIDASAQVVGFNYLENGTTLKSVSSNFYVSGNTIVLYDPLVVGTATISSLSGVTYDAATGFISASASGTQLQIKEAITPMKLDVTAAQRWYTQMFANFNGCWVSDDAFHANGVDDFCKFRNIPNYQTFWYAGPAVFGGTSEGIATFTGALAPPFSLSKTPFTINAGIARFTLLLNSGTFTGTGAQAMAMTAARALLYGGAAIGSSQDWYLIPTNENGKAYDMVRVSDAQAWISWRPR